MAKKQVKKSKAKKVLAPKQSVLPAGFWSQVSAVLLIAFSFFSLTKTIIYIKIKTSLVFKNEVEHNEVLSNLIKQRSYKK